MTEQNKTISDSPGEQLYEIVRFQPDHALGVTGCFQDVYGTTYPTAFVYDPDQLTRLNASGELISVLAILQETGEVVGHCSAQRCYPGGAAESGLAVVKRAHEGHFLLARMAVLLEQLALEEGIHCLVNHEVTSHRASQVIARRAGFKNCCLALGAMPATLEFKQTTGVVPQRESCVVSMRFLTPAEPATISVPSHHREMIEQIYAYLERPVSLSDAPEATGSGSVDARVNSAWGMSDIRIERIGTDNARDIERHFQAQKETGDVSTVFLELPLDQGGTDDICQAIEAQGFFFAGLGPNTIHGGESLFFQHLDTELDMSLVQISSPMGKKILKYVASEQERVNAI